MTSWKLKTRISLARLQYTATPATCSKDDLTWFHSQWRRTIIKRLCNTKCWIFTATPELIHTKHVRKAQGNEDVVTPEIAITKLNFSKMWNYCMFLLVLHFLRWIIQVNHLHIAPRLKKSLHWNGYWLPLYAEGVTPPLITDNEQINHKCLRLNKNE